MKRHEVLELACLAFAMQGTLALGQAPAPQNSQTAVFATQAPLSSSPRWSAPGAVTSYSLYRK